MRAQPHLSSTDRSSAGRAGRGRRRRPVLMISTTRRRRARRLHHRVVLSRIDRRRSCCPSPGQANTFSTSTVPATIEPRIRPPRVSVAVSALGRACRGRPGGAGSRLAAGGADVVGLEHREHLDPDDPGQHRGRTDRQGEHRQDVRRPGPFVARHRQPAELTRRTRRRAPTPSRKSGIARARRCSSVNASSVRRRRPRRVSTAIATPSGTGDRDRDQERQHRQRSVAGSRWAMMSLTGSRVTHRRAEVTGEQALRGSAVLQPERVGRGRAPSRRAATSSGGAVGPSAARTGSPGIRWIIRNDAVTSTHSDTSRRERRTTNAPRVPAPTTLIAVR